MKSTKNIESTKELNASDDLSIKKTTKLSSRRWSLDLLEITLHPSFGGVFNQLMGKNENIHFVSFSWDFEKLKAAVDNNLNFIGNGISMELFPGQTHDFGKIGLRLFSEKMIHDSLNLSFIVFKCKEQNFRLDEKIGEIETAIKSSLLIQELQDIPDLFSDKNTEYLMFLSDKLVVELEEILSSGNTKHITTFQFKFPVEDELDFYGAHNYLKNGIRIRLKKEKK